MPTVLELFESEGTPRTLGGNTPLALTDPNLVVLVKSGTVDVFAIPQREGKPTGIGSHVFRASAGEFLLGLGPPVHDHALVAIGGLDSQVQTLPRERLWEFLGQSTDARQVAGLIDAWLMRITEGFVRTRPPRRLFLLEHGVGTRLEPDMAAGPVRGVVWVRLRKGSAAFCGDRSLPPLKPLNRVPLVGTGWMLTTSEATLQTFETESILKEPEFWTDLDGYHQLLLGLVESAAAGVVVAERERLVQKAARDEHLLADTLARFAAVTHEEVVEEVPEGSENRLLAACQLIGRRIGVTFQAPRTSHETQQWAEPVPSIARASRVRVRRVLLAEGWWEQDNGPILAFRQGEGAEQPVAVLPLSTSRYSIVDPTTGAKEPLTEASAEGLKPFGYIFYRPLTARTRWGLVRYGLAGSTKDFLLFLALAAAGGLLGMLGPLATGLLFDSIIPDGAVGQLVTIVLALLAASVGVMVFELIRSIAALRMETRMSASLETGVWDRMLNLPAPFFRRYTAGDLASRAAGVGGIGYLLREVVLSSLTTLIFAVFSLGLMFSFSAALGLLALAIVLVVLGVTIVSAVIQLRFERRAADRSGALAGLVLQLLTGISRLRVAGAEGRALAVWGQSFSRLRRLEFQAAKVGNVLASFNAALPIVASLLLFGAMTWWTNTTLSMGEFLAFYTAFVQVLYLAGSVGNDVSAVLSTAPLYERARPIFDTAQEVDATKIDPGDLTGDIEVAAASFRYDEDRPLVLENVSMRIRPGEFVALVGPSGAGKSSLLRLLLGFEAPTSGTIYFDRTDLATLDPQAVRRQMGVVLQNGRLFPGDIFTNIVGSSLLTMDDAWAAAKIAGLADDIRAMPMGMLTILSEGGGGLSGGQRQRLLIARAVAGKPRILFLDEATSALDNDTQNKVRQSLEQLKATRVVVAHRLSTIRQADRIYVIEGGKVVQVGSYNELINQPGLFTDLARRQLL